MRTVTCCLLAALVATAGCMDMGGIVPAQPSAKKVTASAAPSRPPVTEDQVTEANTSAAVQALTEELNREAATSAPPATSKGGVGGH